MKKRKNEMDEKIEEVMKVLRDLSEDSSIPKNIKFKVEKIISILSEEKDSILKINTALNELDEITNDTNIQPYTRTQFWNLSSLLEAALV